MNLWELLRCRKTYFKFGPTTFVTCHFCLRSSMIDRSVRRSQAVDIVHDGLMGSKGLEDRLLISFPGRRLNAPP